MKGINLSPTMEQSYEPYRNMCEEFIIRLNKSTGIRKEQMFSAPLGSVLLPKDLEINYDKSLEFPAPKKRDVCLAQRERQLITEVLSFADVPWDTLLSCCTYNCQSDLMPLQNYYAAFPAIRNVMQVMNQHIAPEKLAKLLRLMPFHAFQFRFLDFPDSIRRRCQLYLRGYAVSFYERVNCLREKNSLDENTRRKLLPNKSLSGSVDKVLIDWTVFTEHASLNRAWFGDEPADEELEYVKIGETLGYIVVGLALSGWSCDISLEEVAALLEMDCERISLLSLFQYIEAHETGNTISIYDGRSNWLTI